MSDPIDNLKQGFSDPRTRLIFLFIGAIALVAVLFGTRFFKKSSESEKNDQSVIKTAKGVQSIPGAVNQTEEYARLQRQQNQRQAENAKASGNSAIPTIVGSQLFGSGKNIKEIQDSKKGVGFSTLAHLQRSGKEIQSAWYTRLKASDCSDESLRYAISQGANSEALKQAGCQAKVLCELGFRLPDLVAAGYSARDLKECEYSPKDLKGAGFSTADLRKAGVSACEQKGLAVDAATMLQAGYTPGELKGAGFSNADIRRAGGIPISLSDADINKLSCRLEDLRAAKQKGISARQIKKRLGCSAKKMSDAGYVLQALRDAGYNLNDLREAGFSAAALKQVGFSAGALRRAGFSAGELKQAGFSATELRNAAFSPAELKALGFPVDDLVRAGYTVCELSQAGVSAKEQREAGRLIKPLAEAGLTAIELKAAGFNEAAVTATQPDPKSMRALIAGGCSVNSLKAARLAKINAVFIKRQLACPVNNLKQAGFSAAQLRRACYAVNALKQAGFSVRQLRSAGFTAQQLKSASFSVKDLANGGFSADQLADLGFSPAQLREAGFSAGELRQAGFNVSELKLAGFTASDLKNAGFSTMDLKLAGFKAKALKSAGFSAAELREAGFLPTDLANAGLTLAELRQAGFGISELKAAGFSAKDLKAAGFGALDLKEAGFGLDVLKSAGFSPSELKAVGFQARALREAGFSPAQLKSAGFDSKALRNAGFSASQLKEVGFSARALKEAGYSAKSLLKAGFPPKQLSRIGFSDISLRRGAEDLLAEADAGNIMLSQEELNQFGALANGLLTGTDELSETDKLETFMRQQSEQLEERLKRKDQRDALANMERYARQLTKNNKQSKQQFVIRVEEKNQLSTEGNKKTDDLVAQKKVLDPGYDENDLSITDKEEHFTRAGDLAFAILDTTINSDEPGPIMATIVSGPFRGAKLLGTLGTLTTQGQKVALNFNSMTLLGAKSSVPINSVAIDPNTARTALSSYTDNHILLRYGSLFASSFMQGYAQAISERGTTVTTNAAGDTSVSSVPLDGREQVLVAVGEIGTNWATEAKKNFNRKPTIHIYSGTNMAILFTQDFVVKIPKRDDF